MNVYSADYIGKRITVLREANGIIAGGQQYSISERLLSQRRQTDRTLTSNGLEAPDISGVVLTLYLLAAFGDTARGEILQIKPYKDEDNELAESVLETLELSMDVSNKIHLLGRLYLVYGDIKIKREVEKLAGNDTTFYTIVENPYSIDRIEYKNRLIGYWDTNLNRAIYSNDLIHQYNTINPTLHKMNVGVSSDNTNSTNDKQSFLIEYLGLQGSVGSSGKTISTIYGNTVRGNSLLIHSIGALDLVQRQIKRNVDRLDDMGSRVKAIVSVNTGNISDFKIRNDIYNKVISSYKASGDVGFVEIGGENTRIEVTNIGDNRIPTSTEEINFISDIGYISAFLSSDIIKGEKNIFDDYRTKMVISNIRESVISVINEVIKIEFGKDILNKLFVSLRSSLPEENKAFSESVKSSLEILTALSDLKSLMRCDLDKNAIKNVSDKLGFDVSSLIDIKTIDKYDSNGEIKGSYDTTPEGTTSSGGSSSGDGMLTTNGSSSSTFGDSTGKSPAHVNLNDYAPKED